MLAHKRKIIYTDHLKVRLQVRGIPEDMPRFVYENAKRRCVDQGTGFRIAMLRTNLFNKRRDVAITYREYSDYTLLITIHPLKQNQLKNRLKTGRWKQF